MRTIALLLFLLFSPVVSLHVSAQEIEWQNTIGGLATDELQSIQQTSDGGYICGGSSNSGISGEKTEASLGGYDFWVIKLNANGSIQWQNSIGGDYHDKMAKIRQTPDGGFICGGSSKSDASDDKTQDSRGDYDYWIIKLNASGVIQWQKTIGGNDADILNDLMLTADGGYICGGTSRSDSSGEKTENSLGLEDYWVVKLDANGIIQWQNTIGGSQTDHLNSIQQTIDGGYICGGWSDSNISGDKTENSQGVFDYWIVKLDSTGNLEWQNTIGGAEHEDLNTIEQTFDGGYICSGTSYSQISGDKSENCQGFSDFWVVKLSATGTIEWQNTLGGSLNDFIGSIKQTDSGGYICGGWSDSNISGDKTDPICGNWDYWLLLFDQYGQVEWQNSIGGVGFDQLKSISLTDDGGYICGGYSTSLISCDKNENCQGFYDFWVVKISYQYNLIKGTAFADLNGNNLHEPAEPLIQHKMITELNTGIMAFTDAVGNYSLALFDSLNYEVEPAAANSYYTAVPASRTGSFSSILQTDSLNDFAFQALGTYEDLCITISPVAPFRSGSNAGYLINYGNEGTTMLNPTIVFYIDSNITFLSAIPAPSSITSDSVVFILNTLAPFQNEQIQITILVDQGLAIGTLINSSVVILPVAGDANPFCNYGYWEVLVTGSFDPNDILVNRDVMFDYELPASPWLEYLIRFQNTGNDTAFYVRVENKISSELQHNSIEMISSSHPCSVSYLNYDATLRFTFSNILLPDSNVNEQGSHGFVRYRIKPQSTLVSGDSIRNNARIYFDYNAPVNTNTAVTTIVTPLSLNEFSKNTVFLYPNPVTSQLSVELSNSERQQTTIALFSSLGQKVRDLHNGILNPGKWTGKFDISGLEKGIYFITVTGGKSFVGKIVKM